MATANYPIDGNKLWDALRERYGTVGAAGIKIGYSDSAFLNPCRRGEISEKLKIAAETILGVPYELYAAEVPTPRIPDVHPTNRRSKGDPCMYCADDCAFLGDTTKDRFNASVAILPKRKVLEVNVNFGETGVEVISDHIWINYCPNCGRKL